MTTIKNNPESISASVKATSNSEYKSYNSGLRALLSMRDVSLAMEKHYAQINRIEKNMESLEEKALSEFEGHCSTESFEKIKNASIEVKDSVSAVTQALYLLKVKIVEKNRSDSTELWSRFDLQLERLKTAINALKGLCIAELTETVQMQWEGKIGKFETALLTSIVSYARSCRVEMQMLERYTSEEMDMIAQIVFSKIPKDFNLEEVEEYEKDYLSALKEFKKEFSEKKNLWDTFLDILAGGVHQSPSERVMLERWIEGEKGSL